MTRYYWYELQNTFCYLWIGFKWFEFNPCDCCTVLQHPVFIEGKAIKDQKVPDQSFPNSTLHWNQSINCFNLMRDHQVQYYRVDHLASWLFQDNGSPISRFSHFVPLKKKSETAPCVRYCPLWHERNTAPETLFFTVRKARLLSFFFPFPVNNTAASCSLGNCHDTMTSDLTDRPTDHIKTFKYLSDPCRDSLLHTAVTFTTALVCVVNVRRRASPTTEFHC